MENQVKEKTEWAFEDPRKVFDFAIKAGHLNICPSDVRYAGNYMYMGTTPGCALFISNEPLTDTNYSSGVAICD